MNTSIRLHVQNITFLVVFSLISNSAAGSTWHPHIPHPKPPRPPHIPHPPHLKPAMPLRPTTLSIPLHIDYELSPQQRALYFKNNGLNGAAATMNRPPAVSLDNEGLSGLMSNGGSKRAVLNVAWKNQQLIQGDRVKVKTVDFYGDNLVSFALASKKSRAAWQEQGSNQGIMRLNSGDAAAIVEDIINPAEAQSASRVSKHGNVIEFQ